MIKINHDLTKVLIPKYANKWVGMNPQQTKVVVVGNSPVEVLEKAKKKGYSKPVLTYVVEDYASLVSAENEI
ncbi:MAG: DUF5678 domain-containing protein [bacterium]|nr:DUF5678 domain-containing protein [bacterium]